MTVKELREWMLTLPDDLLIAASDDEGGTCEAKSAEVRQVTVYRHYKDKAGKKRGRWVNVEALCLEPY